MVLSNDVAMTVLPNAPIDSATQLPVPTIAVATDGGISVIKDDGNVVDMAPTYSITNYKKVKEINFTDKSNILSFKTNSDWIYYYTSPSGDDVSQDYWNGLAGFIGRWTDTTRDWGAGTSGIPVNVGANGITKALKDKALGHTNGLEILQRDLDSFGNGMHAGIATNFNTGWQHGDIKGAFLSDTDATNVTGAELVTNGTFDTNTTGWTALNGATLSISSNRLLITGNGSSAGGGATQSFTTVSGQQYILSYIAYAGSINSGQIRIGTSSNSFNITFDNSVTSSAYDPIYFTATGTTTFVTLGLNAGVASSGSFGYDNVSVTIAEQDRSVNNKGLQVLGTITKTPVATGADLVAYSGWSASNYLEQPTNSDITSLTSFSFMGWINTTQSGTHGYLFSLGGGSVNARGLAVNSSDGKVYTWDPTNNQDIFTKVVNDGSWHFITFINHPTSRTIYVDGVLDSTIQVSSYTTPSDSQFRSGVWRDSSGNFSNIFIGNQALQRLSATIPSAEQIKKIYEDEKVLFQENAKATLYGSSDAVTALAYDDTTELLHVGTSAGRSEFQGLRRINNTTTAVTTAISASNELVAEQ